MIAGGILLDGSEAYCALCDLILGDVCLQALPLFLCEGSIVSPAYNMRCSGGALETNIGGVAQCTATQVQKKRRTPEVLVRVYLFQQLYMWVAHAQLNRHDERRLKDLAWIFLQPSCRALGHCYTTEVN